MNRIEIYKDMVHVHQYMFFLFESGSVACKNLARFIERSHHHREEVEHKAAIAQGKTCGSEPERSYAAVLRKTSVRDQTKGNENQDQHHHHHRTGYEYEPAYLSPKMVRTKSQSDGVEWVLVQQNGDEAAGDEGVPLSALDREYKWWG